MKTLFLKFMALFAAITTIVGCEKEDIAPQAEGSRQTITAAALSKNPDTKVTTTPNEGDALGFKVAWEVGDKLNASSADGATYIATFEIKSAGDIAADGSATFTAVEGTTTFLESGTDYKFCHSYGKISYNEATDISPYDNYFDEAFNKNNLMHTILHTASATTIDGPIALSHLLSYVELTVDVADNSSAIVRLKYTDTATSKEFVHKYELYNWDGAVDGTSYTFSFPVYPATLSAAKPVTVELSTDSGSTYTSYLSKAVDGAFEAGKHYRIKKDAVTPPPSSIGFPADAVPALSFMVNSTILQAPIPATGLDINNDTALQLKGSKFFIGYHKVDGKYQIFDNVKWSLSSGSSKVEYLEIVNGINGSMQLKLINNLPTSEVTVTVIATAPNNNKKAFEVHLCKEASAAPSSVALDRDMFVANAGAEMTLSPTVLPITSTTNKKLNWTSSDTSVATVDANGKVRTVAGG